MCNHRVPAHPRSRGENGRASAADFHTNGSSPLTRGKHMLPSWKGPEDRLIPAHAGKTSACAGPGGSRMAHPRSRGENSNAQASSIMTKGSSPLTRGKPLPPLSGCKIERLIPAHAGKTAPIWLPEGPPRAHPRSRGENSDCAMPSGSTTGSSPLTRGKPAPGQPRCHARRLIPAHAGKTTW